MSIAWMRLDGAIILDILNLIGRFFKFGMETKQFSSPSMRRRGMFIDFR
jgi:hypothetical protein